ncbi:MAG: VWA domain-containing protein [Ilumatobacteraceae bacterium]|nr:VWA domain-containing protein [Ilumatobacteraceae bacterium]
MTAPATRDLGEIAVAFARVLRGAGLDVPASCTITYAEALAATGVDDRDTTYWVGRTTLVRRQEDVEPYDRAFAVFWEDRRSGSAPEPPPPATVTLAVDDGPDDAEQPDSASDSDEPTLEMRFSRVEVLRHKDFAEYSTDELAEAQALMARLRLVGSPRRALRLEASAARTARPDLRRTVRASMRSAGEPMRRHWRAPTVRPRRLVLILDVSGSMEPYARALVRFVHAAVAGRQKVEAFALGTRLTRLTRELSARDPDLQRFNDDWGQRGTARGATVVILSDGWDRGDPELLAEQMARLHRVAHRVVWVNPLKVSPGYAPLARGMAAALPHVDEFVEGHSVEALEHLARVIARP